MAQANGTPTEHLPQAARRTAPGADRFKELAEAHRQ